MNKKEDLHKIPLYHLQSIRILLSRLYRDERHLHKDIKVLLFYIYNDWNKVKETIEIWRDVEDNLGDKNE